MLRDDLNALCDGEKAKYACEEAAGRLSFVLNCRESEFARRMRLKEPEKRNYTDLVSCAPKFSEGLHICAIGEGGIVFLMICFRSSWEFIGENAVSFSRMMSTALMYGAAVGMLVELCGWGIWKLKQKMRMKQAVRRYEEAVIRYRQELKKDMQNQNAEAVYREEMTKVIGAYQAAAEKIGSRLEILYGELGIPEHLQGLAAADRFREYIDSGGCSGLAGRDGAYARFRSELRAGLIDETADELRRAGNRETPAQADLLNELRMIAGEAGALLGADGLPDASKKREYDRYIARHAECLNGVSRDPSKI